MRYRSWSACPRRSSRCSPRCCATVPMEEADLGRSLALAPTETRRHLYFLQASGLVETLGTGRAEVRIPPDVRPLVVQGCGPWGPAHDPTHSSHRTGASAALGPFGFGVRLRAAQFRPGANAHDVRRSHAGRAAGGGSSGPIRPVSPPRADRAGHRVGRDGAAGARHQSWRQARLAAGAGRTAQARWLGERFAGAVGGAGAVSGRATRSRGGAHHLGVRISSCLRLQLPGCFRRTSRTPWSVSAWCCAVASAAGTASWWVNIRASFSVSELLRSSFGSRTVRRRSCPIAC